MRTQTSSTRPGGSDDAGREPGQRRLSSLLCEPPCLRYEWHGWEGVEGGSQGARPSAGRWARAPARALVLTGVHACLVGRHAWSFTQVHPPVSGASEAGASRGLRLINPEAAGWQPTCKNGGALRRGRLAAGTQRGVPKPRAKMGRPVRAPRRGVLLSEGREAGGPVPGDSFTVTARSWCLPAHAHRTGRNGKSRRRALRTWLFNCPIHPAEGGPPPSLSGNGRTRRTDTGQVRLR